MTTLLGRVCCGRQQKALQHDWVTQVRLRSQCECQLLWVLSHNRPWLPWCWQRRYHHVLNSSPYFIKFIHNSIHCTAFFAAGVQISSALPHMEETPLMVLSTRTRATHRPGCNRRDEVYEQLEVTVMMVELFTWVEAVVKASRFQVAIPHTAAVFGDG